jgi:uncharacterized membrane protein
MSSAAQVLYMQVGDSNSFMIVARRNCSLAPLPLCALFLALASVSLAIALAWGLGAGAWPVIPFAGMEVVALGAALVWHARRVGEFERISLQDGLLVVEVAEQNRLLRHEFNPRWARVDVATGRDTKLTLRSHGRELEIGRHLDGTRRRRLAADLRRLLTVAPETD